MRDFSLLHLQLAKAVVDRLVINWALLPHVLNNLRILRHSKTLSVQFLIRVLDRRQSVHSLRILQIDLPLSIHLAKNILGAARVEALAFILARFALWCLHRARLVDAIAARSLVRFDPNLEALVLDAPVLLWVIRLNNF